MTFSDVIELWPNTAEFSRDVGVTIDLASKWRRERGIPSEHWQSVLKAAEKRGYQLSAETLLVSQQLHQRARERARKQGRVA